MKKILIADDSATARKFIRKCIGISLSITDPCQIEWIEVSDGNFALQALLASDVDLLITDLNMPNLDGEHLLKEVKSQDKFRNTPVFVITSIKNPAKERDLLSYGAAAVLPKPVSPALMSQALKIVTQNDSSWSFS